MPDQKKSEGTEEQGQQPSTQEQPISMNPAYKKLQGDLQKAKDKLKEYEARDLEGQSVEAQLVTARQELADATRELKSVKIKAAAPAELHDWIDTQFSKGRDLDEEDIQDLVARMTDTSNKSEKTEKEEKKSEPKEKSGVRNSTPKQPDEDAEADELLKKTPMSVFFGPSRR